MKTIRFGDLVRGSGRPRTITLWTKPEDDPSLTSAIRKNRVLTVVQEHGRKDHGIVGFKLLPGAVYLEFPNPLPQEEGARVIGLNYQLIDEPTVPEKDRVKPGKPAMPKSTHKTVVQLFPQAAQDKPEEAALPEPVVEKPKPRQFVVRVRRTATVEDDIKVKALDQAAAELLAVERAKNKPFKPGKALKVELVRH